MVQNPCITLMKGFDPL